MNRPWVERTGDIVHIRSAEAEVAIEFRDVSRLIASLEALRSGMTDSQKYRNWERADDDGLREMVSDGLDSAQIAAKMGRSPGAVRSRRQKLGMSGE